MLYTQRGRQLIIHPAVILRGSDADTCPSNEDIMEAKGQLLRNISLAWQLIAVEEFHYQFGATRAFIGGALGIDRNYMDGVSLTHGPHGRRTHIIWTSAISLAETYHGRLASHYCRCVLPSVPNPPQFDHFCWPECPVGRSS